MGKSSQYVSKIPNEKGVYSYTPEEDAIWRDLYARQQKLLLGKACDAYLEALERIELNQTRVPQLKEVSKRMAEYTGWGVEGVPALIPPQQFFTLLAEKKFPAATFVRTREEFDYLQEPDIFHEVFGHCPLLTNEVYAAFMQRYGEVALSLDKKYYWPLLRLYWFTVEFGLMKQPDGRARIYGAGIVSSVGETEYALGAVPEHRPFDLVQVLRTPYRIDIYQTVYYVIESFEQLFKLVENDLAETVKEASELGLLEPTFPPKEKTS